MENNKEKALEEIDENKSFTNMDVSGIKKYDLTKRKDTKVTVTKYESKAITKGIIEATIVPIVCVILGFGVTVLLMYFWLFA